MSVSRSLPPEAVGSHLDAGAAATTAVEVGAGDRRAHSGLGCLGSGAAAREVQQVFRMEFLTKVEELDAFIDLYQTANSNSQRMKVTVSVNLLEGYRRFDELAEVMGVRVSYGDRVVVSYSDIDTEITVPEWATDVIADNIGDQGILNLSKSVKSLILDNVSGRIGFVEGGVLESLAMDNYLFNEPLFIPASVNTLAMKEVKGSVDLSLATSLEDFSATVIGEGVVLTFSSSLKSFNAGGGLQVYGTVDLRKSSLDEIVMRAIAESSRVFPSGRLRCSGEESPALPVKRPRSLGRRKSSKEVLKS